MKQLLAILLPVVLFSTIVPKVTCSSPNILFLVVDDLGYTDVGHHGAEYSTPNIDYLASVGIDLQNYYVAPVCTPTRSSFMTGRYCWRVGLQNPGTMPQGTKGHIPLSQPTIGEQMKQAGYNTQLVGKWHLGFAKYEYTPEGRGFDQFFGYYGGAQDYYTHLQTNGYDLHYRNKTFWKGKGIYSTKMYFEYYFNLLEQYFGNTGINNNINNNHRSLFADFYNTNNQNKNPKRDRKYPKHNLQSQASDSPLFTYFATQTVHAPIQAPPKDNVTNLYINASECYNINDTCRQDYCLKIKYLDYYIGQLIDYYKKLDLWDNTLFIFTTDNGGMPDYNDTINSLHPNFNPISNFTLSCGCNYPMRGGKVTMFQGGVKGTSMVSGGLVPEKLRNTINRQLYHAVDWFPSILNYIGQSELIPSNVDGVNIIDSLFNTGGNNGNNSNGIVRDKLYLFENIDNIEHYELGNWIEAAMIYNDSGIMWKYIYGKQLYECYYPPKPAKHICLNNNTSGSSNDTEFLFNLNDDPYEMNNLINQYSKIAHDMRDMILQDAIENGYEYNEGLTAYNASCPEFHNGTWVVWDKGTLQDDVRGECKK